MHQQHDFAFGWMGLEMREDLSCGATVVGFEFFAQLARNANAGGGIELGENFQRRN